jgi:hypothetical protein
MIRKAFIISSINESIRSNIGLNSHPLCKGHILIETDYLISSIHHLNKSVQLIDTLDSSEVDILHKDCYSRLGNESIHLDQHSPELWIPNVFRYHPLSSALEWSSPITEKKIEPIFFYVEAYPFMMRYCHNWDSQYSNKLKYILMKKVVSTRAWELSQGRNFMMAATHPMTPLSRSSAGSAISSTSFLTTDYDVFGTYPKDIIVPYFTEVDEAATHVSINDERDLLLFGASGGKGKFVRQELWHKFKDMGKDVFVTGYINHRDYIDYMHRSRFCLVTRGDTSSTRRLFAAINAGCIPLIISHWISLPFERIIDYSTFTVTVDEGDVFNYPQQVIQFLRSFSKTDADKMRRNLLVMKRILFYDSPELINPVSLTVLEGLLIRVNDCVLRHEVDESNTHSCCFSLNKQTKMRFGMDLKELSNIFEPSFS